MHCLYYCSEFYRYMTSKCHSLTELEGQLDKFGFRGEAVASLREVSGLLNITSRAQSSSNTYCKVFAHGKSTSVGLTADQRPSHGTTITVQDFLYNMPVRKKRIKESVDFEEMKTQLESLALVHPHVSFSLRNDASGKLILQTRKCQNTVEAFKSLFGIKVASSLRPIEFSKSNINITGFIGKEVYHQKTLQFLYINDRLIVKTKLHKLINMILAKSFLLKAPGPWLNLPIPKDMNERFGLPMPKKSKHAVFIINLKCPYTEYDITLDPRKTLVQFKNWDQVLHCVEEGVKVFLQQENLTVVSPEAAVGEKVAPEASLMEEMEQLDKEDVLSEGENEHSSRNKRKHKATPQLHIARAVHGLPAKRHKSSKAVRPDDDMQQDKLSSPVSEVHSDSDDVQMSAPSTEESNSPSPKKTSNKKTKHSKKLEELLSPSSDDSADDSSSPVTTWAKYKAREKAKASKKAIKQKDSGCEHKLPVSLNKLKIYSLAASTLKKTFAHHNESEKTVLDKPATIFPVRGDDQEVVLIENDFFTPTRDKEKSVSPKRVVDKVQEHVALIPSKPQSIEGPQCSYKENVPQNNYNECITSSPIYENNKPPEPQTSHSSEKHYYNLQTVQQSNTQTQHPLLNFQNMARVPENHQYDQLVMIQRNSVPSPTVEDRRHFLSSTELFTEKCGQSTTVRECYDTSNRVERLEGCEVREQSLYQPSTASYEENIWSTEPRRQHFREDQYLENYQHEEEETEFSWSHKKQKESYLSPLSASTQQFESPSSCNDDAVSTDSMSEGHYERFEARLREPLEQISREINKTRHSMLHSMTPDIGTPGLSYGIYDTSQSQVSSRCEQNNTQDSTSHHSGLKFHGLSAFAYDKRNKSQYRPSSHKESAISMSESQKKDDTRPPADTPFTKLSKHISEIENLTLKKYSVQDSFDISTETPSVGQIMDRQRLAGLDHAHGRAPFIRHISQLNQKLITADVCDEQISIKSNDSVVSEDILSTSDVLMQLGPPVTRVESNKSIESENLLFASVVLQQLDPSNHISSPQSITSENLLSTTAVLRQLGPPPATSSSTASPEVLFSGNLPSPNAVPQQPCQSEQIVETNEDLLSSKAVLQKLAPQTSPYSFHDTGANYSDKRWFPMTPGTETDFIPPRRVPSPEDSAMACDNMEPESPITSNTFPRLVPYSASSGSEDMECQPVNQPSWRSIVDAPNDPEHSVSGSNDSFLALFGGEKNLSESNVGCISQTPHISQSLTSMLLENKSAKIFNNIPNYVNSSKTSTQVNNSSKNVSVLSETTNVVLQKKNDNNDTKVCDKNDTEIESDTSPTTELPQDKQIWEERVDPNGRQYYVNTKSGVTTYDTPVISTQQFVFSMTPRHSFMPKGTSPVLQLACDKQTNAVQLNEIEQQQLQDDVTACLEDGLDTVKWAKQPIKPSGK